MTSSRLLLPLARGLAALSMLLPLALPGCGSDVSGPTCEVDGVPRAAGESFPSADGCNTCSCSEDGSVACTVMACFDGCSYEGILYTPGESFPAADGCNTCTCAPDGSGLVGCTKIGCVSTCEHQGVTVLPGESVPAGDGCNTCTCDPGGSGQMLCTLADCAGTCTYAGVEHPVGGSFPALDGCNTCTCEPGGAVSCTEIACPCDPPSEWWRDYVSTDVQECQVISFVCPPNTTNFENGCGCGCEQDAACPEYFDCMPPASCDVPALMEACPYSGFAY